MSWIVPVVTVLALLVGVANTFWMWWSKSNDADAKKLQKFEDELAAHAGRMDIHVERIGAIEGEMRHLPSKDEFHRLALKMTEMGGEVSTIKSEMGGVGHTVRRIDDFLREKAA